ncbi:unnamed protein product [Rangifer tarandus platyrhynchus]|uniref:Uncharacterized protein n=1 Tax=Rangifer tarandus platyrhynchus TaxID=3082113 RepID=A0AC60A993_RANTA
MLSNGGVTTGSGVLGWFWNPEGARHNRPDAGAGRRHSNALLQSGCSESQKLVRKQCTDFSGKITVSPSADSPLQPRWTLRAALSELSRVVLFGPQLLLEGMLHACLCTTHSSWNVFIPLLSNCSPHSSSRGFLPPTPLSSCAPCSGTTSLPPLRWHNPPTPATQPAFPPAFPRRPHHVESLHDNILSPRPEVKELVWSRGPFTSESVQKGPALRQKTKHRELEQIRGANRLPAHRSRPRGRPCGLKPSCKAFPLEPHYFHEDGVRQWSVLTELHQRQQAPSPGRQAGPSFYRPQGCVDITHDDPVPAGPELSPLITPSGSAPQRGRQGGHTHTSFGVETKPSLPASSPPPSF